jgi:hypothetical protein
MLKMLDDTRALISRSVVVSIGSPAKPADVMDDRS